ncbi:fluoride efflux transporter FluC [Halorubrum vacuolatum]|uniref:Fluoride-specific ion channel FluC n=1 Tax=Halorubrum vacuolatum TaxID=63740 RepID=A0A238W2I6_HALVU|nr:CrcB family protein [Halorubrum vacuolatum]SNR40718.1 CrcB protein [Halorubrum vacuolatum]
MTDPLVAAVLVGLGGAIGAVSRHAVGLSIDGRESVIVVNALGSFTLGVVLAGPVGTTAVWLVGVGFCGAFTTFSSFAVETVSTAEDGEIGVATAFAVGNLVAALLAIGVGLVVGGVIA